MKAMRTIWNSKQMEHFFLYLWAVLKTFVQWQFKSSTISLLAGVLIKLGMLWKY